MRAFTILAAVPGLLVGLACTSGVASAAPFGPARLGFQFNTEPTYALGSTSGTLAINSAITPGASSGTFSTITSGSGLGTLTFSLTVGTTINEAVNNLFTFTNLAGSYTYNATSVETTAGTGSQGGGFSNIELYVLGTASGGVPTTTPTVSSIVFNLTGLNGNIISDSETFANPPSADPNPPPASPVPEPATLAVLSIGLLGVAIARRRRSD